MSNSTASDESDQPFAGLNRLHQNLRHLDERGLVLSLAAFAEDSLGELLRTYMLRKVAASQLIDGFNAPLGTFSARIKAAYALGLITDDQFSDIEILRKIRNDFSHTWEPITFDTQSVRDRILAMNFSTISDKYPGTVAEKLRETISARLLEIRAGIAQMMAKDKQKKQVGFEVIAGPPTSSRDRGFEDQLEGIAKALADLDENLANADEHKAKFFLMIRRRWKRRLEIIASQCPPELQGEFDKITHDLAALLDDNHH